MSGARGKRVMNLASAWSDTKLKQSYSWGGKEQRVAEMLGGKPLRSMRLRRMLKDDDKASPTRLSINKMQKERDKELHASAKRATMFEKVIMNEVSFKEHNERVAMVRRRGDAPMLDENPYSNGYDYRMGAGTSMLDFLPILKATIKFADELEIEKCVRWIHSKHRTVGQFANMLARDYGGGKIANLLDTYGDVYRHVELLVRLVLSQEELRKSIARDNNSGRLKSGYGEQVYALPGCYRLSRKAPHNPSPQVIPDDPGSYGPWKWYESDFGTDTKRLKEKLATGAPTTPDLMRKGQRLRRMGIHGGRSKSTSPVSWRS